MGKRDKSLCVFKTELTNCELQTDKSGWVVENCLVLEIK